MTLATLGAKVNATLNRIPIIWRTMIFVCVGAGLVLLSWFEDGRDAGIRTLVGGLCAAALAPIVIMVARGTGRRRARRARS